ncbi:MAG: hypothetical protein NXI09_09925 [Bacteroidetes bacterium]|nr:hypothetical protein [Bacteroidota bacterium]
MRSILLLGLFFVFGIAQAQDSLSLTDLARWGRISLESPIFEERDSANQRFNRGLQKFLSIEGNYLKPLPELSNMMRLESPDKRFAIYTWQRPNASRKYERFGLLAGEFKGETKVIVFKDQLDQIPDLQFKRCEAEEWPGAIYYKIIEMPGEKYKFALLGLAMGESLNRKIIEIIKVGKKGKVTFGERHFKVDDWMDRVLNKPPRRLVLTYNAKYSSTLRWNEEAEMIIMDHLAPPEPKMKGLYQMYGPDFSYDGLFWDDGWWHLKTGVNFNTGQQIEIKPPSQPKDLPYRQGPGR